MKPHTQRSREWYARNRERILAKLRKKPLRERLKRDLRRYGVSPRDFRAMQRAQADACAICLEPARGVRRLSIDHDHLTGKVRGLLCRRCNSGLGHFLDDPLRLELAAAYLRAKKKITSL